MIKKTRRAMRWISRLPQRAPAGSAPGTIVIDPAAPKPVIHVIAYGPDGMHEATAESPGELADIMSQWPVVWINVTGLGDAEVLRAFADQFRFHRLAIEDVVNVFQRPKVEPYDTYIFIVNRMMRYATRLETEQLSIFLGEGYVITFQERPGDCFDEVRKRIEAGKGRIRKAGTDYLAYALIDAVIDSYYPLLERYGEQLEGIENEVLERPTPEVVNRIHQVKRELLAVRRAIWPLREAMNSLVREDTPLIVDETRLYLRDCYDHTIQIADMLETYRELASGLMDMYLSSVGNRMNEIMKVLTIFAAIFIPLSFIAGLYGMNFDTDSPYNIPELSWRFGYFYALGLMALVAFVLLGYFRHKGWIGGRNDRDTWRHGAESDPRDTGTERPDGK